MVDAGRIKQFIYQKRWLWVLLAGVFVYEQYKIWVLPTGVAYSQVLENRLISQNAQNKQLKTQNQRLHREINSIEHGGEALEAHARMDLGWVKAKERFIRFKKQ